MKENHDKLGANLNWSRMKLYNVIFIVVLFMIAIVGVFFVIISNLNQAVKYYGDVQGSLRGLFGKTLTPTTTAIYVPAYIGLGGIVVILMTEVILTSLVRKSVKAESFMILSTLILHVLAVIFSFLISYAEFSYANFSTTYDVLSLSVDNKNFIDHIPSLKGTSALKMIAYHKEHLYKWTNDRTTWWLQFMRLAVILVSLIIFRSAFSTQDSYAQNVSRNLESNVKRTNVGKSKVLKFIGRVFATNEQTISWWALIVTIIILIPQFIYAILLSMDQSEITMIIQWSTNGKQIVGSVSDLSDFSTVLDQIKTPSAFLLVQLPIIIVGASIVTSLAFIFNIIRQWRTDISTFVTQLSVSVIEMILTLMFGAISKGYMNYIVSEWNANDMFGAFAKVQGNEAFQMLTQMFAVPVFNSSNELDHVWLYGLEYVTEFVISITLFSTCYIMICHRLLLIVNMRREERSKIVNSEAELQHVQI
jgi:hypothetical protein